jgi:hypothetical protein
VWLGKCLAMERSAYRVETPLGMIRRAVESVQLIFLPRERVARATRIFEASGFDIPLMHCYLGRR